MEALWPGQGRCRLLEWNLQINEGGKTDFQEVALLRRRLAWCWLSQTWTLSLGWSIFIVSNKLQVLFLHFLFFFDWEIHCQLITFLSPTTALLLCCPCKSKIYFCLFFHLKLENYHKFILLHLQMSLFCIQITSCMLEHQSGWWMSRMFVWHTLLKGNTTEIQIQYRCTPQPHPPPLHS